MVLVLALLGAASAAPMELTHTGRLLDIAGIPLDGPHSVTLSLYPDDTATSSLWTEAHDGTTLAMVAFDNGYFSVRLGAEASNPLDNTVFDGTTRYIGLSVDGSSELGRQPIVSVPYAIHAATAVNLDGGTVNASEVRVNDQLVIDSNGNLSASGTLSSLACDNGDTAFYNGSAWACSPLSWSSLSNIPSDFLDGTDADLLAATTCPTGQLLAYTGLGWGCVDDQVLDDAAVDAFVENGPLNLDANTTLGSATIATGAHYTDANVEDGPLNLDANTTLGSATIATGAHYTDANAISAVSGDLATWGLSARRQGMLIMPEGPVQDDGAGTLIFGGNVIVMNPAAGSFIRVASGSYALGSWGYLYVDVPPGNTRAAVVTPQIAPWVDTDRPYDHKDRVVLAQRRGAGRIFLNFALPAAATSAPSLEDVRWLAQHGAAAAACAAVSPQNDSASGHIVLPRQAGVSCTSTCANNTSGNFTNCRSAIAIGSLLVGQATSYTQSVASNYNYVCTDTQNSYDELAGAGVITGGYAQYCCCYR